MGIFKGFGQAAILVKHERTREERNMVLRLDIFLMTFGCISQGMLRSHEWNMENVSNAKQLSSELRSKTQGNDW
jgi:hypothetical protein